MPYQFYTYPISMLIVRVKRKRGDSKYVKAGVHRSSGGSIRLRQAEIHEYIKKGELYVVENQNIVDGCLLISIDGTMLSIKIISLSLHHTTAICKCIIEYTMAIYPQAKEIVISTSRQNNNVTSLFQARGLLVLMMSKEWISLYGSLPLRENNNLFTRTYPYDLIQQPPQRSLL